MKKISLIVVGLGLCLAQALSAEGHSFIYTGKIHGAGMINAEGNVVWKETGYLDIQRLPNGNFLQSRRGKGVTGVYELSADRKIVWEYKTGDNTEVSACERLADGNTMLAVLKQPGPIIMEVGPDKNTCHEFRVPVPERKEVHNMLFAVRHTPDNTYLVCTHDGRTIELDRAGKITREFKGASAPYMAIRLNNGNTLVTYRKSPSCIVEFNKAGDQVWKVSKEDLPAELGITAFTGVARRANGNTVVANYRFADDGKIVSGASLIEISPEKTVVWKFQDDSLKGITAFQLLEAE